MKLIYEILLLVLILCQACTDNQNTEEVGQLLNAIETISDTSEPSTIQFSNVGCLCQYSKKGDWLGEELIAIDAHFNLLFLTEIYHRTGVPDIILTFSSANIEHVLLVKEKP